MSTKARTSAPGSRSTRWHNAARCPRRTDSSWRACPKPNSRNSVPTVEGAYTPPNRVFIPPARSTSMSSMLSAPVHIPAISVASFGAGFADPDVMRGWPMRTFSDSSPHRPVCSAKPITGTRPASDTRWSSSNTADSAANLCETCTGSAFPNWTRLLRWNTNHPSSEGTFLIPTPQTASIRRWIEAKARVGGLAPHELRHMCGSLAIRSRASIKTAQRLVGHATATMTLDNYGHLYPDELDQVAQQMG